MRVGVRILFALLAMLQARSNAFTQESSAPISMTGQIFLPDGDVPRQAIAFDLEDEDQQRRQQFFTDSNGRFVLDGLISQRNYRIVVRSNDVSWDATIYRFVALRNSSVRFALAPLKHTTVSRAGTLSAAGAAHKPLQRALDLDSQGMAAAKAGRYSDAEDLLRKAIAADPKYSDAFNDLAVIQLRQREYREAEKTLRDGLQADPKSAALQSNLGAALNHLNRFSDAVPPLEEAERLDPSLAQVHVQLGAAYVETGKLAAAQKELELGREERGAQADRDAILQMYLGELYAQTGDFKQSIAAFDLYLADAPDSANASAIKSLVARMESDLAKKNE